MGRHHPTKLIVCGFILLVKVCGAGSFAYAESHQEIRLFVVEKSKNPQNILVVYTSVNETCEIQPIDDAGARHLFDLYWLMDGATFKPTHRLIKKAARKRFVAENPTTDGQGFTVLLTDLKELNHDLPSDRIQVEICRDPAGNCQARVVLVLGPSHANRTMAIETIYSKAKTFLGIPVGVHYIELRGKDIQNHAPIKARFDSNHQNDYSQAIEAAEDTAND